MFKEPQFQKVKNIFEKKSVYKLIKTFKKSLILLNISIF